MDIFEAWTTSRFESMEYGIDVGGAPFALLQGEGRFVILGEDPLLVLDEPDPSGFVFHRKGPLPPVFPDFIGVIGYEFARHLEPLIPEPAAALFSLPEFQFVLYRRIRIWDREQGLLHKGFRHGSVGVTPTQNLIQPGPFKAFKQRDSDDAVSFGAKVERIRREIGEGNVYQVNLTRQEIWGYEGSLLDFADRLVAADPAPYSAFIAGSDFAIISASPEAFLHIDQGRIVTRPIKGTAPRGMDSENDLDLARQLLSSAKNRSELAMITDLLRNDLSQICTVPSVRVDAFPELESYARVHHLVSTVSGELKPGITLREILLATFPGGSITGCPKLAAMTLIRELEDLPRGIYTGALGWFSHDLSQVDLSIAIRTAWASRSEICFGVGGGIVWDSEPMDEYLETVHKGASLTHCLSDADA